MVLRPRGTLSAEPGPPKVVVWCGPNATFNKNPFFPRKTYDPTTVKKTWKNDIKKTSEKSLEIDSGRFSETAPDNLSPGRPRDTKIDPKTTPKCTPRARNESPNCNNSPKERNKNTTDHYIWLLQESLFTFVKGGRRQGAKPLRFAAPPQGGAGRD